MSSVRDAWARYVKQRQPPSSSPKPKPVPRRESKLEATLAYQLGLLALPFEREYRFDPSRRWRFDFAFLEARIGVELQGGIFTGVEYGEDGEPRLKAGRHSRAAGMLKDFEKWNAAVELGWRVLVFGPPQVTGGEAALTIERIVNSPSPAL